MLDMQTQFKGHSDAIRFVNNTNNKIKFQLIRERKLMRNFLLSSQRSPNKNQKILISCKKKI